MPFGNAVEWRGTTTRAMTEPSPGVPVPPDEWFNYWAIKHPQIGCDPQGSPKRVGTLWQKVANEAAEWGADEQLKRCVEWMRLWGASSGTAEAMQAAMRPKVMSAYRTEAGLPRVQSRRRSRLR